MTILNQETITTINTPWFWAILILGLIAFAMGGWIVCEESKDRVKDYTGAVLIVLGATLAVLGSLIIGTEKHERIEAIITDEFPATELLENYTVIEQRGDIWVLEVKEKKNDGTN